MIRKNSQTISTTTILFIAGIFSISSVVALSNTTQTHAVDETRSTQTSCINEQPCHTMACAEGQPCKFLKTPNTNDALEEDKTDIFSLPMEDMETMDFEPFPETQNNDYLVEEEEEEEEVEYPKEQQDMTEDVEYDTTNQPVGSVADELSKLANLNEQGVITEEEFSQIKSNLIGAE